MHSQRDQFKDFYLRYGGRLEIFIETHNVKQIEQIEQLGAASKPR